MRLMNLLWNTNTFSITYCVLLYVMYLLPNVVFLKVLNDRHTSAGSLICPMILVLISFIHLLITTFLGISSNLYYVCRCVSISCGVIPGYFFISW